MNAKMIIGVLTVGIIVVVGLLYEKFKAKSGNQVVKSNYNKEEAVKFVNKLDELSYFKYADSSDLEMLKSTYIEEFDTHAFLTSVLDEQTLLPKDYRNYYCDGETVYEQGGIIDLLKDLETVFQKMDFKCVISNHFEEWDEENNWLNHSITINGTNYIIFEKFKEYGWGEAPFRIAQILNTELQKQNIDEQVYLVHGGNDGRLVILTKEQYKYIYATYKDNKWKPLEINEWAKEFNVNTLN